MTEIDKVVPCVVLISRFRILECLFIFKLYDVNFPFLRSHLIRLKCKSYSLVNFVRINYRRFYIPFYFFRVLQYFIFTPY